MRPDAVVVGAGPNGLAAAVVLARAGLAVHVVEANDSVGGGARTEEATLPGFHHDLCSAVHPLGIGSPLFSTLPLERHGLAWVHPELPLAHPLDGGRAAGVRRSLAVTADALPRGGRAYAGLLRPFVAAWPSFVREVLDTPFHVPRRPRLMARFGARALLPTTTLARALPGEEARALLAGCAAHSAAPLERVPSAALGLVLLVSAHAVGWPFPRGGAAAIPRALSSLLRTLGGTIETGRRITSLDELPPTRATLLALGPRQIARLGGRAIPDPWRRRLERWCYGPGAFKVDWALDGPIPWTAEACRRAGTVHVGGTLAEIAEAERAPWRGRIAERPFVLLAQPSLFDPGRAPPGRHTAWAYTHVPNGWPGRPARPGDIAGSGARGEAVGGVLGSIERQVERFAPGFRERILARRVWTPAELEAGNANLVGGDIGGGAPTARQWFGPPRWTRSPWSTPVPHLYVCSSSTPPGGGVHGMCGYHAARTALERSFGLDTETVLPGAFAR